MQAAHNNQRMAALTLGAIGIVYGDIGTSPLYAVKECFGHMHGMAPTPENILGIMSLLFWTALIVVSLKYMMFILRADNRGEGGILALMALTMQCVPVGSKWRNPLIVMGLFGAALFFGESVITPAISVLSAVEGAELVTAKLKDFIIPITLGILIGLFVIQKGGTAKIGKWFGPIMVLWFSVLAILGVSGIMQNPSVLLAVNPWAAVIFIIHNPLPAFLALGSVVLVITGGEALYADMGHFGIKPIRRAWFFFVWPALMLNYFGQAALLLAHPEMADNPFFKLAPSWSLAPLVVLAAMAAIIASQAVISGAFSVASQAVQLGYCPRLKVLHTSEKEIGQIYVPMINWGLLICVLLLVLAFRSSSNLAAAYGITVMGTMVVTSILAFVVMRHIWQKKHHVIGMAFLGLFLCVDLIYLAANSVKIPHGGWFPLALGGVLFVFLTTWKRGREILSTRLKQDAMPLEAFIAGIGDDYPIRVPGVAVFMTSTSEGVPHALLHNLKHNKVLHDRVILLTVKTEGIPYVDKKDRFRFVDLGKNFTRVTLTYGFKEDPDVPCRLEMHAEEMGFEFNMLETSFFLSRETLIPSKTPGMALWREHIFAAMSRNAQKAKDFFKIPANRVVELGSQIEL